MAFATSKLRQATLRTALWIEMKHFSFNKASKQAMKSSRVNLKLMASFLFMATGFSAFFAAFTLHKTAQLAAVPLYEEEDLHSSSHNNLLPAVEIDEKSCASRYDPLLLNRPSFRKPSRYLISKLRDYEARHKRCGPYTVSYNKTVMYLDSNQAMPGAGVSECKYIIWKSASGLGNQIMTLASTFLYALLTDRVLLINRENNIPDLFCEPFPETTWLIPFDFPLSSSLFRNLSKKTPDKFGNMIRKKRDFSSVVQPYVYLHLGHDYDDQDQLFFCDQEQSYLKRVPWLISRSDNYFIPSLFSMTSFRRELNRLFPDKETVFHLLGRYLFHPTNSVWGLVSRYYEAYLSMADIRVGIQIRNYHVRVVDKGLLKYVIELDHILKCSKDEGILPRISEQAQLRKKKNNKTVVSVLITSLHRGYSEEVRDLYWEHPTTTGEAIAVYQPSFEERQKYEQKNHDRKALAEMYLLSMSDKLMTTSRSTFGYVAQGFGGLRPWILFHNDTGSGGGCKRVVSMEPCFHSPPLSKCKTRRDRGGDIGRCDGVITGIKLIGKPRGRS